MSAVPRIFVSAVTKELGSARELVAQTLRRLRCDPVFQDEFEAATGVVTSLLEKKLSGCDAVIQLVGHRYGWGVHGAEDWTEVMSYIHFEARHAHEHKLRIWYLIVDDGFPVDGANDEHAEQQALQRAYRIRVQSTGFLYYPVADRKDIELAVFRMLPALDELRPVEHRWIREEAAAHTLAPASLTKADRDVLMRDLLDKWVQVLQEVHKSTAKEQQASVEQALYRTLGTALGTSSQDARERMETMATKLKDDESRSLLERARAAYTLKEYAAAEKLSLDATKQANISDPHNRTFQVECLMQAAQASREQIQYARALNHLRTAEKLTERKQDPLRWAEVQHLIAFVLDDEGKYSEVIKTIRPVISERRKHLGDKNVDTLQSRNILAIALGALGRQAESEAEHRAVLKIRKQILGPYHGDTLKSRSNLGNIFQAQRQHPKAEREHRAVLEIRQRVLGPNHPDTLKSRNNLAVTLQDRGKFAEAEAEYRPLLILRSKILGSDHPSTLKSRSNLVACLQAQGKHTEAEIEGRAVLQIQQRVLRENHPDIVRSHLILSTTLLSQEKHAEAERELRAAYEILKHTVNTIDTDLITCQHNLALCLFKRGEKAEAGQLARKALKGWSKTVGPKHPNTKEIRDLLATLTERTP